MTRDIFDKERVPPAVDEFLRNSNPWWEGKSSKGLPAYRRWAFPVVLKRLKGGLAPIIVLRGPRQVGKTTLQMQIIDHLLREEKVPPKKIFRVQFDEIPSLQGLEDPILALVRWYENRILENTLNETVKDGGSSFLFFDEAQNLSAWAPQLKALVDHHSVKVLVTGSSALRIEAGRDSLAGRISTVDMGTLLLREIDGVRFNGDTKPHAPFNGLEPLLHAEFWRELQAYGMRVHDARDRAFAEFSKRGGYPVAHVHPEFSWPEVADQLNENVVKRAIVHDLRMGKKGQKRDQHLLEEVFRLSCRYAGQSPGQSVFVAELKNIQAGNIGWARVWSYLKFLDNALLLKLVPPLELRLKRRKGNSKICLCDHGLRASWLQEEIPLDQATLIKSPHLSDLAGHIAESVVGSFLGGLPHLGLAHFPERGPEPEVDYVMTIGAHRIPLEVKYRNFVDSHRDTLGLRAFIEKSVYNAPFGILVTMTDDVAIQDPRIIPVSLPSLLLLR